MSIRNEAGDQNQTWKNECKHVPNLKFLMLVISFVSNAGAIDLPLVIDEGLHHVPLITTSAWCDSLFNIGLRRTFRHRNIELIEATSDKLHLFKNVFFL
jgi:hypothetical protein